MDTTPENIEMCRQAGEIQALHNSIEDGDYYYWSVDEEIHISFTVQYEAYSVHHPEQWDYLSGREIVWLPSQDQLQDMIGTYQEAYTLMDFWKKKPLYFIGEKPYYPFNVISSAEMLWLAFVMHEKYGKSWGGSEWVEK